MGVVSRGKYTLPNTWLLATKVLAVPLMQEAKKVHTVLPAMENKKLGVPSVESPAMPPNTTLNSTVVISGFRMIHSGPRMVCLYMTVKLRLTNMTIRSR